MGLQTELNKESCTNGDLRSNFLNSTHVERMVVSTYGSYLAESLADWSEQIIKLGQ